MSLRVTSVDVVDGLALVHVAPSLDPSDLLAFPSVWDRMQQDPNVRAVAALPSGDDFATEAVGDGSNDLQIRPKRCGLLKPFGVGLTGWVCDHGLQLLADADVSVATGDARIADTSATRGFAAAHAAELKGLIPDSEVRRLALLGAAGGMSAQRASDLGLIDAVVGNGDLERELRLRLERLLGDRSC